MRNAFFVHYKYVLALKAMEVQNEIRYIADLASLETLAANLLGKKQISFDTEFDRFYREYGFKLSLLQIYDGETCFIVDPIKLPDLSSLWPAFEDNSIMKVAYSCSEDIQILKLHGCQPRNIYDLQIAAKMGDYPALSYADLLLEEMNIELDKSLQRSDWRRRPLSKKQLQYASQDVVPLLRLQETVHNKVLANGTAGFLAADNNECEEITVSEYTVKLSGKQKKTYDSLTQRKLYALMIQRDEIARQYNMPPANVSGDRILEEFINNPGKGFPEKGIASRLREDDVSLQKMASILELNEIDLPQIPREQRESYGHRNSHSYATPLSESDITKIKEEVTNQYGQVASDHILRGFKKFLTSSVGLQGLRPYQQEVVKEMAQKYEIIVK